MGDKLTSKTSLGMVFPFECRRHPGVWFAGWLVRVLQEVRIGARWLLWLRVWAPIGLGAVWGPSGGRLGPVRDPFAGQTVSCRRVC